MKALSIKQPWATLIAHGIKDIENRTWRTSYRGRIYIHASAKPITGPIKSVFTDDQWRDYLNNETFAMLTGSWPNGAIIGEVDIIDCFQRHPSVWAEHSCVKLRKIQGEMIQVNVPVWNWVLANPVLYDKPIENVKGALSLWEYTKLCPMCNKELPKTCFCECDIECAGCLYLPY